MATTTKVNSRLTMVFETGVNGKGQATFGSESFYKVKTQAANDDLYRVVQDLQPLLSNTLAKIERDNTVIIGA